MNLIIILVFSEQGIKDILLNDKMTFNSFTISKLLKLILDICLPTWRLSIILIFILILILVKNNHAILSIMNALTNENGHIWINQS